MSEDLKYLIELIQSGQTTLHYELVKYLMRASPFEVLRNFAALLAGMGLTARLVNDWFHIERKK